MEILAILSCAMTLPWEIGSIGAVIENQGGRLQLVEREKGHALPASHEGYDGLVVFGGAISAADPAYADHFDGLGALIRDFHAAGKPVLGSCLGSQSIARAFGGRVHPIGFLEFGFIPLHLTHEAKSDRLLAGTASPALLFDMHSDTFELPEGAVPLMVGEEVPNQVFRVGETTYAFQCHFEATAEIAKHWIDRELGEAPDFPQERVEALHGQADGEFAAHDPAQQEFGARIMRRWMALVAEKKAARTAAAAAV